MSKALDSLNELFNEFEQSWQGDDTQHRLDLAEVIWRALKRTGWTQRQLAKESGLADADISLLMHGEKNFTSSTLGKVVHALKVKVKLQEASYEPQEDEARVFRAHPSGEEFRLVEDHTNDKETKISVKTTTTIPAPRYAANY